MPSTEATTPVPSSAGQQQSVIRQLAEIFLAQKNESALVNPKKAMNLNLVLQLCASVCFCLTSIFLRHFSNVGFQLIITALANLTFCVGAFYVINRQPDSMSVGACLGSGIVISVLSLITAVYWGELSKCEEIDVSIRKYTCDNKAAMRVMCFFAVLLFIFQVSNDTAIMTLSLHLYVIRANVYLIDTLPLPINIYCLLLMSLLPLWSDFVIVD